MQIALTMWKQINPQLVCQLSFPRNLGTIFWKGKVILVMYRNQNRPHPLPEVIVRNQGIYQAGHHWMRIRRKVADRLPSSELPAHNADNMKQSTVSLEKTEGSIDQYSNATQNYTTSVTSNEDRRPNESNQNFIPSMGTQSFTNSNNSLMRSPSPLTTLTKPTG